MRIGGYIRTSLSDFPGRVAAVVFTAGCNFRCPYCHNPALADGSASAAHTADGILVSLKKYAHLIDGVVISGGEPTLHRELGSFIREIRKTGLAVKLDTNGYRPRVLRTLINEGLLDFIAMDVKAPPEKYAAAAGRPVDVERIRHSIDIIESSGIDYRFRTTVARPTLDRAGLLTILSMLRDPSRYRLQPCRTNTGTLDPYFFNIPQYSAVDVAAMEKELRIGEYATVSRKPYPHCSH